MNCQTSVRRLDASVGNFTCRPGDPAAGVDRPIDFGIHLVRKRIEPNRIGNADRPAHCSKTAVTRGWGNLEALLLQLRLKVAREASDRKLPGESSVEFRREGVSGRVRIRGQLAQVAIAAASCRAFEKGWDICVVRTAGSR